MLKASEASTFQTDVLSQIWVAGQQGNTPFLNKISQHKIVRPVEPLDPGLLQKPTELATDCFWIVDGLGAKENIARVGYKQWRRRLPGKIQPVSCVKGENKQRP